ncbi:MAG: cytochrome C oxidase assembly protein [Pseudomonadota bacterium]
METMRRDHELHLRRRGRNLGVLVALLALVVMLFLVTIVKMGPAGGTVGNPAASQAGGWGLEDFAAPFQSDEAGTGSEAGQ